MAYRHNTSDDAAEWKDVIYRGDGLDMKRHNQVLALIHLTFQTLFMFLRAFESISAADNLIGLAAAVTTVTFLYKGCRAALASKNGIPLPPEPLARWFWDNALPSVK